MHATSEGPRADRHIGAFAELYALGALDYEERAAVEAHVARCSACVRPLSAAEAVVAALGQEFSEPVQPPARLGERIRASARAAAAADAVTPPNAVRRQRRPLASVFATAASLVVAAGIAGGALAEHGAEVRQTGRESAILATLANAHFFHVTLTARDASAPVSKALYSSDGAWLYVIVDSPSCHCSVVARSGSSERALGEPDVRGTTATLFTRDVLHPTSVALENAAGHVIADATLRYSAP